MNEVEIRKAIQDRTAALFDCHQLLSGAYVPAGWGPDAGWQLAQWGGLLLCWPRRFVKPTIRYGSERILVVAVRWGSRAWTSARAHAAWDFVQAAPQVALYRTDRVHGHIHVRPEGLRIYNQNEVVMATLRDQAFGVSIFDVHDQREAKGYSKSTWRPK